MNCSKSRKRPPVSGTAGAWCRIAYDFSRSLLFPVRSQGESGTFAGHAIQRQGTGAGPVSGDLRLLSWNVHRNYSPESLQRSLLRLLAEEQPDVVLLQEVPVYADGPFWNEPRLREPLADFHLLYAPAHRVRKRSRYYDFDHAGQLTLSRFPFSETAVHELPTVSRPKLGEHHAVRRVAIYTRLETEWGSLGLYNLHLENTTGPEGRRHQILHLLRQVRESDDVVVLGGDFNTLFCRFEWVESELTRQGFASSFAGERRLLPRLDHFYVRGAMARGRRLAGEGSDHQPILARLSGD